MSDIIKHECGLALVRLLKPLDYYLEKYGSALYGLEKLRLLMQKQRNRGQDGAGLATIKLNPNPGTRYISRKRSISANYLEDLFEQVNSRFKNLPKEKLEDAKWLKDNLPYTGELLMGHLRYGTYDANTIETCHPLLRANNWISRSLIVAGNFNLTNVDDLFKELVELGQHPKEHSDTVTVMEKIGHYLDDEVQRLRTWFKPDGYSDQKINELIVERLDIQRLLKRASCKFDGGYVMAGMIGHGDAFMMRDPAGIRPAFYYHDDEIVVAASERPTIQTTLDVHFSEVKEIPQGHALIVKADGRVDLKPYIEKLAYRPCSFERVYFSRGTDRDIYLERKNLGKILADEVLEAVDYDFDNTVFSFVPNTAETSFLGLVKGVENKLNELKKNSILAIGKSLNSEELDQILNKTPRVEKIVVKDEKLRTFIAANEGRNELVSHAYDVTYGIVRNHVDTLVLIDDSIVRGTTIRNSILKMTARLKPKKIIFVSAAPQIRYPDCYGIDMSRMNEFVAFRALVELLRENNKEYLLEEAYHRCIAQVELPDHEVKNQVAPLYDEFTYKEISKKIGILLTPPGIEPEVEVIYQTIEGLHKAIPTHNGDWYFSGNYPTPGGNRVVNKAFINYMEKSTARAY